MQSYNKKPDFAPVRQVSGYVSLILAVNQEEIRARLALSTGYIKHIPMFREYMDMMEKDHKKTYVLQYLADRYGMHPDSVKRVVARMLRIIRV